MGHPLRHPAVRADPSFRLHPGRQGRHRAAERRDRRHHRQPGRADLREHHRAAGALRQHPRQGHGRVLQHHRDRPHRRAGRHRRRVHLADERAREQPLVQQGALQPHRGRLSRRPERPDPRAADGAQEAFRRLRARGHRPAGGAAGPPAPDQRRHRRQDAEDRQQHPGRVQRLPGEVRLQRGRLSRQDDHHGRPRAAPPVQRGLHFPRPPRQ